MLTPYIKLDFRVQVSNFSPLGMFGFACRPYSALLTRWLARCLSQPRCCVAPSTFSIDGKPVDPRVLKLEGGGFPLLNHEMTKVTKARVVGEFVCALEIRWLQAYLAHRGRPSKSPSRRSRIPYPEISNLDPKVHHDHVWIDTTITPTAILAIRALAAPAELDLFSSHEWQSQGDCDSARSCEFASGSGLKGWNHITPDFGWTASIYHLNVVDLRLSQVTRP